MMRILACLLVLAGVARADGISVDLDTKPPHASAGATTIATRPPRIPGVLAGNDATKRQYYEQLLAAFEQEAAKNGQSGDVALAVAVYLASSYSVYRGVDVSNTALTALTAQLRDRLAANAAFQSAPLEQKQDLYESMAVLGLVMAVAHGQHQDAAVRATAKSYLETFLHADPDTITLDDHGLARATASEPSKPAGKAPAIAALVWSWRMQYDALSSGFSAVDRTYLLLADGTCTLDLPASLDVFDPAASRAAKPNSWCTWRKAGKEYQVAWSGKFETLPKQVVLEPAKHGAQLDGLWTRQHASSVGTASAWTGRTVTFKRDGSFTLETATAFQTNGADRTARGAQASASSSGDTSGTYTLDGYTLELHFGNGTVERRLYGKAADDGVLWFCGWIVLHKS